VNPTLSAYYVELLALVFLILTFYRAASFAFGDGRTRRFAWYAELAAVLCAAAMADSLGSYAVLALYAGGFLTALSLLTLRLEAECWAQTPADADSRAADGGKAL
jgi:hypothetical protein